MKIEVGKWYRTRHPYFGPVRILATDHGSENYPVVGERMPENGSWIIETYTADGKYAEYNERSKARDLVAPYSPEDIGVKRGECLIVWDDPQELKIRGYAYTDTSGLAVCFEQYTSDPVYKTWKHFKEWNPK